jgi:hypothetical protein
MRNRSSDDDHQQTWQDQEPWGWNNGAETPAKAISSRIRDRIRRLIRHQERLLELRREQQRLRVELAEIRCLTNTKQALRR